MQLRDKAAAPDALRARARELRELTASCGASLIVNGDAALAADVDADGVHVPGFTRDRDVLTRARAIVGPARSIHVPVHTRDEVVFASDAGADALLVSPIFDSPGKGPARGTGALAEAREVLRASRIARATRIYALGGVDASHVSACHRAGADGVAIIRALFDAPDPIATAMALSCPWLTASRSYSSEP
ncbi:thiamine phosphate synthase [Pendulispora albinea]|uniref:thiamine phosphate synthase n=1 Tax=Pendulispora albinea TaxID=2741071 RepID=UPI00374E1470